MRYDEGPEAALEPPEGYHASVARCSVCQVALDQSSNADECGGEHDGCPVDENRDKLRELRRA